MPEPFRMYKIPAGILRRELRQWRAAAQCSPEVFLGVSLSCQRIEQLKQRDSHFEVAAVIWLLHRDSQGRTLVGNTGSVLARIFLAGQASRSRTTYSRGSHILPKEISK